MANENNTLASYRPYSQQSKHYFSRTHTGTPKSAVTGDAVWLGANMRNAQQRWRTELSTADITEIEAAVQKHERAGLSAEQVTKETFELPRLSQKIQRWRETLRKGRGFIVVSGLPVTDWGEESSALAYWGIGHHLGLPGAQNPQGDVLGHIIDYGEEATNPNVRRYRTSGNIDFHCDAADVVGLLCLNPAKSGGQSRIASSVAVFNEVQKRLPHDVARMFEPFMLDLRGEHKPGNPGYLPIQPCCYSQAHGLQTFYHSEYFRSAKRFDDVTIDAAAERLLDAYDNVCADENFYLDMWLEPGDMQFISNHTTLHARTAYEDWPDKSRRRHLLRLWLSL